MSAADVGLGSRMAVEIAEADAVFGRAALREVQTDLERLHIGRRRALYTIARGSSDAVANVLSYEIMRELRLPVTSLPPSVLSLGSGVAMDEMGAIVISQSGASEDLVLAARGIRAGGGALVAITNLEASPVEAVADVTLRVGAGSEHAVPATKTVIGSLGAGMALLAALMPDYADRAARAVETYENAEKTHPRAMALKAALLRNPNVYVIGRDASYGAALEIALKIKETCAIHAEAYSSAEVLHGPLQLAARPLLVLILDTGQAAVQESLDTAEARFSGTGRTVIRVRPGDVGAERLTPTAAAALLLRLLYPVILSVAVTLGYDPDAPTTLSKVTVTR